MGFSSVNFSFLECYDPQLVRLAALADHHFTDDPNASLLKLRLYAELMAQLVAIKGGIYQNADETQSDLLRRLRWAKLLPEEINEYFHQLRLLGNRAAHDGFGNHAEALNALKIARVIGVWFHRAFGTQPKFSPGPFVPPQSPAIQLSILERNMNFITVERGKRVGLGCIFIIFNLMKFRVARVTALHQCRRGH